MNIVQTQERVLTLPGQRRALVYIEESKTNYYVSFRPVGWESWFSPIKVKKSKIVCNMLIAVHLAYKEYMKTDIWGWRGHK